MLLLGLGAGCSRHVFDEDTWPVPDVPVAGGTLRVAIQADGRTLDPHRATDAGSMRLIENFYNTIMRYTPVYGEVEPELAQSVHLSDDQLTYTFTFRTNVYFHSGRRMTAADVRYSIERIIDAGARAEKFAHVVDMDTPTPDMLRVHLDQPIAPLLTYLAYPMNAVVDREVVEAHDGELDRVVAGTGPFQLVEWQRDRQLLMERHENYFRPGRPLLDRVIFRPIPDETARTTALRNREIDLMLDVPDKDKDLLLDTPGLRVVGVPGTFWEYIGLNTDVPPFDDVRVRQAVAWAVDRDMINRLVKRGRAHTANGEFLPPAHWAHTGVVFYPEPDLDRARALLREAGYDPAQRPLMRVGSAFPYQVAAAQIVRQQLLAIGMDVEIRSEESSVFFDALGRGDFAMTLVGWLGFVDPDEWFYNIFHSDGVWNQQNYANTDVDQALALGRRTADPDARKDIYRSVQQTILKEAPVVLLYINAQTTAFNVRVRDYLVHPTATTRALSDTWLVPPPEPANN